MTRFYYPNGKVVDEPDKKFSVSELIKLFGGWYYLRQVPEFSGKMDYYLITKELYGIYPEDYPKLNKKASEVFGREIYGLAILCPESMVY